MSIYEMSGQGIRQFLDDQPKVAGDPRMEEALQQFNDDICEEANIATHYAFDDVMTLDRALVCLYDDGLGYPGAALAAIGDFESTLVSLTAELDPGSPLAGEESIFEY